jgi:hypothetical protein
MSIDITKASLDELNQIKNEVLRNIALRSAITQANQASGHDSHSSSHGKNNIVAERFGQDVLNPGLQIHGIGKGDKG